MPGRDGTGPMGIRGRGRRCLRLPYGNKYGAGFIHGLDYRRGFCSINNKVENKGQLELLKEEKELLENRLQTINEQLEKMSKEEK